MIRAGIFGATGYTGIELIRLINHHPEVELIFATSDSQHGKNLKSVFPSAPSMQLISSEEAPLDEVEAIFLCLPHAASASLAQTILNAGVRVIDLSADFRLKDQGLYLQWYEVSHPVPHLLKEAVYGLTEFFRKELVEARLVANPGCYPTSALLALQPALKNDLCNGVVIIDAKSGVSGAGRKPSLKTHFVEVAGNLSPYNIGRVHRHLPEIEQAFSWWSSCPPSLIFSPHLIPAPRGLLSTIYVQLQSGWNEKSVRELYQEAYADEAFVEVLPEGEAATYAHVNYSNRCVIGITSAADTLILTSAIDNLRKGASGQALQNLNVMFGLKETHGLV
jgi:N-acetyl-gamma-glutamyl-phosphate reductase